MRTTPDSLDIAVRVFSAPRDSPTVRKNRKRRKAKWRKRYLIFDTETTRDTAQEFLFGVLRYCEFANDGRLRCLDEKIIYADSLETAWPEELECIREYCRGRMADTATRMRLRAIPREDFARLMINVLRTAGVVVAFNLPFDLSRVALGWGRARTWHPRAFSLWFGQYEGGEDRYLPRICMSLIDSKRAFYKIRGSRTSNESAWRGAFLDLRTLAYALSGKSLTLRSAGEEFGAEELKADAPELGHVTEAALDYCRADVRATASLMVALRREFDLHPKIDLLPWRAYSPASIGKAYLRAGGVKV
jgi:hypothetical protein